MKKYRNCIRLSFYFVIFLCCFVSISQSFAIQTQEAIDSDKSIFQGRWRTDSGSIYEFVDSAMICISVHDKRFRGWINKVAIKNFRLEDDGWYVDQAIRYHDTGKLSRWMVAKIEIINKSSFSKTIIGADKARTDLNKPQLWERVR